MQFRVRVVGQGRPIPRTIIRRDLRDTRCVPPEFVDFDGVTLERVDFSGARFGIFSASGARFLACDFRGARFETGSFGEAPQTVYRDCRFERADLRRMWNLGQARFEGCIFDQAKIHDWWGDAAEFIDCHFAGRITECRFSGRPWGSWEEPGRLDPPRTRNEFRGNDFRQAQLMGTSFVRGIDIGAQLWPEGPEYIRLDRWRERVDRAREVVARWEDDAAREEALLILRVYSEAGYEEQDELFTRRDVVLPLVRDRLWDLLAGVLP